jgi:hypothetical protein
MKHEAGKLVEAIERPCPRPGDEDLVHVDLSGDREIDEPGAIRCDDEVGGDDVSAPVDQRLIQLIAGGGHEHDVDLRRRRRLQPPVDLLLQPHAEVVCHAALDAPVHEVVRPAVRREQAQQPALNDAIEIANPWASDDVDWESACMRGL